MVKKFLLMVGFFLTMPSMAQRISSGIHFGTNIYEISTRKEYYLFPDPQNTYNVYYGPKRNRFRGGGFSPGGYLQLDYKAFLSGLEVNLVNRSYFVKCYYMMDKSLGDRALEFKVTQQNTEINWFSGLKLLKRNRNVIVYAGFIYAIVNSNTEVGRDNENSNILGRVFMGNNEMYNVMYNDLNFWRLMGGVGYTWKNSMLSLRYDYRINSARVKLTNEISSFNLHYNLTLNFQKLKKGHFIFQK